MAHAGTMVGGSAQTKQSGSRWAAVAVTVAVVAAMIAGVWLTSSAGLAGGTAKLAADRSFDQIEAQRGAVTLSSGRNPAHATPYAGDAVQVPLSPTSGTFHPGHNAVLVPPSPTSGTFHPGHNAVQVPPSATSGTFHPGGAVPPRFSATSLPGWSGP